MLETAILTPLGHQILAHWRQHRPTMVSNLEREGLLNQTVSAAQEFTWHRFTKSCRKHPDLRQVIDNELFALS